MLIKEITIEQIFFSLSLSLSSPDDESFFVQERFSPWLHLNDTYLSLNRMQPLCTQTQYFRHYWKATESRKRIIITRNAYLFRVTIGEQSSITAGNLDIVVFNVLVLVED